MKKKLLFILSTSCLLALSACGNNQQGSSTSSESSEPSSSESSEPSTSGSSSETSEPTPEKGYITTADETGTQQVVQPVDGTYTFTNTIDDQEYNVFGDIVENIVFAAESTQSARLMLHNANIASNKEIPVQWLATSKKLKVKAAEGENTISCTLDGENAIKSNNNLDISGSAKLTVTALGTAVSATGVNVEGTGNYSIRSTNKNGISAKEVLFGEEGNASEHTFSLLITAKNTGVKCELNSKSKKGTFTSDFTGVATILGATTGISTEGDATLTNGTINFDSCTTAHSYANNETLVAGEGYSCYVNAVKEEK